MSTLPERARQRSRWCCSPATNVSFRDQAYAALKQTITDADIYARAEEIRLDETPAVARRSASAARRSARR